LLEGGDICSVIRLLGRSLTISGTVVEGDKRGKDMGYPTANLAVPEDAFLPRPGIYAVNVIYHGEYLEGVASLGTNPTFVSDRSELSLEVHILDYKHDLYGEQLQIEWKKYIRDQIQFDNIDDLIAQMKDDEQAVRDYFIKGN